MIHRAGTSHIASNFSCIDFATVLYANLKENDEVVWSAGWKAASIYYFLAKQGKIPYEDLEQFPHPPYLGLAETTVPGVLVNGGSVGHGLPVAVGLALGKKRAGEEGTVYVICSDGEMNEGTTWESAMLAAHHKLDNLVVIADINGFQAMDRTEDIVSLDLVPAWEGFGWLSLKIDGHAYAGIHNMLKHIESGPLSLVRKPKILLAKTVKGKGVSFMENHLTYHYKHVSDEDYERALAELV